MQLGEARSLDLLGYGPVRSHPLDVLGYGHTQDGVARWRVERPAIGREVVQVVARELTAASVYPPASILTKVKAEHQAGYHYAERVNSMYAVVTVEKPSLKARSLYLSAEDAAKALVRSCIDSTWVPDVDLHVNAVKVEVVRGDGD